MGTYGVDPRSKTAWAVLNYNADFAVADGIERVPTPPVVEKIKIVITAVVTTIIKALGRLLSR